MGRSNGGVGICCGVDDGVGDSGGGGCYPRDKRDGEDCHCGSSGDGGGDGRFDAGGRWW